MKVAVIGAGIAGMGCAWALSKTHQVVLFEKNARPGGHSRTLELGVDDKKVPVDTGFIVFNRPNYPNLTALFELLGVPIAPSAMSFGVSLNRGNFEYGTGGLVAFFGQLTNIFTLRFWRMFLGVLKFNNQAKSRLKESMTLGELLDEMNLGEDFRSGYLLPMAASIWSTPKEKMLNYPAKSFIKFFDNHGLLTLFQQPQWYTIKGGSREYVRRLLNDYSGETRLSADIERVQRNEGKATLRFSDGSEEHFETVVFACHADQAHSMLADPTPLESSILQRFSFQKNEVVTHRDTRLMHKRRQCWSSWVYLDSQGESGGEIDTGVSLSYWMNNLQPLETDTPIFVTLNPSETTEISSLEDRWQTTHPVFDHLAIDAQSELEDIQGEKNTFYCGAWTGYGFHEDGLRSGLNVAERLGAEIPWRVSEGRF